MKTLVAAEWLRLFSRRVTLITALLIAGLLAFVAFGFSLTGSPPTPAEVSSANDRALTADQNWDANVELCGRVRSGLDSPKPGASFPRDCDYGPRPTADMQLDYGFSFHRQWPDLYYTAAIVLAVAGFAVGASFVGVEWSSGAMVNLLLWRPRRGQVLGAKLLAVVSAIIAISIGYLLIWTGAFIVVALTSGTVGQLTGPEWASLLLTGVRVVLLAAAGTALGFALASIGRHTSTALGVGVAYLLIYELGSIILFGMLGTDYGERYRLSSYVTAWLTKQYDFQADLDVCRYSGCAPPTGFSGSWQQGGVVIAAVVAVLMLGAFASIRRKDVA